jgi:Fic family protein
MRLGEAQAMCRHIAGVPLKPDAARNLYKLYLSKGVHATTSIEGNTLSEEQVQQQIEGELRLPKSQEYLAIEVQNIIDACNQITRDIFQEPKLELTPERICRFNELVLRGLEVDDDVRPGEFRMHSVGVGSYRGAPWRDGPYLVGRLCDWLNRDFGPPNGELKFAYAIIKTIVAHLYIAWIHPFGDGNGRTARLIEFLLLEQSGVPLPAGHLLSNHYNKTRSRYYAELDRSSKVRDGAVRFLMYAVEGFVDGLKEQLDYVRNQQWSVTWENYIHDLFRDQDTSAYARQKHLILDLPDHPVSRRELTRVSPRVAAAYAGKGDKTLSRDINALMKMKLLIRQEKGYAPNRGLILAFLPPRFEDGDGTVP